MRGTSPACCYASETRRHPEKHHDHKGEPDTGKTHVSLIDHPRNSACSIFFAPVFDHRSSSQRARSAAGASIASPGPLERDVGHALIGSLTQ
jgi:hypothetical protein